MKSSAHSQRSLGQEIIRGLAAGCIVLMLTVFCLRASVHFGLPPRSAEELWVPTGAALVLCGFILLIASVVVSFFKSKLAFWGMIISLLAFFVGVFFAPPFIEL